MFSGTNFRQKDSLLLMGIVNVTGDSFSDGGFLSPESAVNHALQLLSDGADILDIGAESTRPGATEVPAEEEIRRLTPVVTSLLEKYPDTIISIDTRHSQTAVKMLELGVKIINDVSGLEFDSRMVDVLKKYPASQLVLCHSRGEPDNMMSEIHCSYDSDVVETICRELLEAAEKSGLSRERIIFDPGFGFAKTPEQQLDMLRRSEIFVERLGKVLFGISRKSFLGKLTGESIPIRRNGSTLAGELHLISCGAAVIRTHDVRQLRDALTVSRAIREDLK
ncbi:MAG: dihydropteroate synthase [Lentisphaeria bacterium]|nr:dihydropteroate synthase [Lentisphaeria bacterium]